MPQGWTMPAGIEPVRPEDYERVVEVWEASVRATHHFVREEDIQLFRPLVRAGLPEAETLVCVRDPEGQVAGWMGVSGVASDQGAEIDSLFIHPNWRGQGLGRRLVEYAIQALGAATVDVNEQNEQAVGFYLKMGFEVAGRSEVDDMGKPYPLLHMRLRRHPIGLT